MAYNDAPSLKNEIIREGSVTDIHGRSLVTVTIKYPWPTSLNPGFQIFNTGHGYETSATVVETAMDIWQ